MFVKPVVVVLVLAAAVCALYGATVMLVNSGTWFFAFWYVLAVVLVGAGVIVQTGALHHVAPLAQAVLGVVAGLALAVFLAAAACSVSGFAAQGEDDLDYIVVLGAQVHLDGPSWVLVHRLETARAYLEENPRTTCIVAGGQGANEALPEAPVMAAYLEQHGIDPGRILEESASLNTKENIVNSMQLADLRGARVGVVTNNFHVFRSVHIARKQGIANVCGIAAFTDAWYVPNNVAREALGILKDLAVGNM